MVINSSQVLISELEFRSHSGDLAPLLYYYKQKPCTLQGRKIDNSLTNICRWCTEMCVFWPKAAALPCFPAEHSANAVIHSPYELLVPLIPLKNCFHTSIAARLILPENILLSEDYSTLLFQRILWSLPPIHPSWQRRVKGVWIPCADSFFAISRSFMPDFFQRKIRTTTSLTSSSRIKWFCWFLL